MGFFPWRAHTTGIFYAFFFHSVRHKLFLFFLCVGDLSSIFRPTYPEGLKVPNFKMLCWSFCKSPCAEVKSCHALRCVFFVVIFLYIHAAKNDTLHFRCIAFHSLMRVKSRVPHRYDYSNLCHFYGYVFVSSRGNLSRMGLTGYILSLFFFFL